LLSRPEAGVPTGARGRLGGFLSRRTQTRPDRATARRWEVPPERARTIRKKERSAMAELPSKDAAHRGIERGSRSGNRMCSPRIGRGPAGRTAARNSVPLRAYEAMPVTTPRVAMTCRPANRPHGIFRLAELKARSSERDRLDGGRCRPDRGRRRLLEWLRNLVGCDRTCPQRWVSGWPSNLMDLPSVR
jgi:hypothetical protein